LLHVLLEGGGGGDGLARILIGVCIRVTGISHSSGSDLGPIEDSSRAHNSSRRSESVSRGHEGGENSDLVLRLNR